MKRGGDGNRTRDSRSAVRGEPRRPAAPRQSCERLWTDVREILPRNFGGQHHQPLFQFAHIFFVSADRVMFRDERFDVF